MEDYIGISENRLHHILGVARKCYKIAKDIGQDETFCRKMFTIGWNHDIGYEFSHERKEHPDVAVQMLVSLQDNPAESDLRQRSLRAIRKHGKQPDEATLEWRILNMADYTTDYKGEDISAEKRLDDIKARYGENSRQYLTAKDICIQTGLINETPERNNTDPEKEKYMDALRKIYNIIGTETKWETRSDTDKKIVDLINDMYYRYEL